MELNKVQKKIVEDTHDKVVVIAASGSGKTRVITEKIKHLLESGTEPTRIVAITFTRAAAAEMNKRLNYPKGVFIGTLHSYIFSLLSANGIECSKYIENEEFDEFFKELKLHPKCVQPIDFLLLDEAQDSNEEQFNIIFNILTPKKWMLVGDPRQSIYQWNGANPELLINLTYEPDVTTYRLNENYRSGFNILSFAKKIIFGLGSDYIDESVARAGFNGQVYMLDYDLKTIPLLIFKKNDYKNWFILARTNDLVTQIISILENNEIPYYSLKNEDLNKEDFNSIIESDTVKVMTIHTSKGLESKNVVVVGVDRWHSKEELCVAYVAATRAKENLYWMKRKGTKRRKKGF